MVARCTDTNLMRKQKSHFFPKEGFSTKYFVVAHFWLRHTCTRLYTMYRGDGENLDDQHRIRDSKSYDIIRDDHLVGQLTKYKAAGPATVENNQSFPSSMMSCCLNEFLLIRRLIHFDQNNSSWKSGTAGLVRVSTNKFQVLMPSKPALNTATVSIFKHQVFQCWVWDLDCYVSHVSFWLPLFLVEDRFADVFIIFGANALLSFRKVRLDFGAKNSPHSLTRHWPA